MDVISHKYIGYIGHFRPLDTLSPYSIEPL